MIHVRATLKKTMKKVVHYMNVLTNAPNSKKTNAIIESRIGAVVEFLIKLNKVGVLIRYKIIAESKLRINQ